jgi:protein TonB
MFEQSTLNSGPAGARAWTTFFGFTTQVALVSFAMLVPMVWPQVLPTAHLLETLMPPLPPGPPPRQLGGEMKRAASRPGIVRPAFHLGPLVAPRRVPTTPIPIIEDEPTGQIELVGIPSGMGGSATGIPGGILQTLANAVTAHPPRIAVPVVPTPAPVPVIPRYKEGGNVMLGAVLHRVEPPYPQLARAARVAGSVELECVVGVGGHIQEVKVKSGNPLLIHAAVDAAWQWVYAPSKLNGVPIEIVTILRFTFRLN